MRQKECSHVPIGILCLLRFREHGGKSVRQFFAGIHIQKAGFYPVLLQDFGKGAAVMAQKISLCRDQKTRRQTSCKYRILRICIREKRMFTPSPSINGIRQKKSDLIMLAGIEHSADQSKRFDLRFDLRYMRSLRHRQIVLHRRKISTKVGARTVTAQIHPLRISAILRRD